MLLLFRLAAETLPAGAMEAWGILGGAFLRKMA